MDVCSVRCAASSQGQCSAWSVHPPAAPRLLPNITRQNNGPPTCSGRRVSLPSRADSSEGRGGLNKHRDECPECLCGGFWWLCNKCRLTGRQRNIRRRNAGERSHVCSNEEAFFCPGLQQSPCHWALNFSWALAAAYCAEDHGATKQNVLHRHPIAFMPSPSWSSSSTWSNSPAAYCLIQSPAAVHHVPLKKAMCRTGLCTAQHAKTSAGPVSDAPPVPITDCVQVKPEATVCATCREEENAARITTATDHRDVTMPRTQRGIFFWGSERE